MKLMAIVNCTPDSFYDGRKHSSATEAIAHAHRCIEEGADILDIGGESTRPGAEPVSIQEECRRVIPVVEALANQPCPISIDTAKPEVAKRALSAGASIINDVTGFRNPKMRELAAASGAEIVVMHMQGDPQTMQIDPRYPKGVIDELALFFETRVAELVATGVREERIVLDPGIGFGKSVQHNCEILLGLARLRELGFPILVGASRKAFLSKILSKPASELLSATIAVNTIALLGQVEIIRVHDVREHRDVMDLLTRLNATR